MARGEPTDATTVALFRAKYIELGTVSAAARAAGIAQTTGWYIAQRADADPEFVEARKRIHACVINEAEDNLRDTMAAVHDRIRTADLTPDELASIAVANGLKSFSYQNPKPQYLKAAVDFYKALVAKARFDAEKTGEIGSSEVTVKLVAVDGDGVAVGNDGDD